MAKVKNIFDLVKEDIPIDTGNAEQQTILYTDQNPDGLVPEDFELPQSNELNTASEIEEVSNTATAINAIANNMSDCSDIPPTQYNALANVAEHLMTKLNKQKSLLPKMESFDGRMRRKNTITTSLETIKDAVMAAVKKIGEWIRGLGKWLFSLFQKSRTSYKGISNRAKRLIDESKLAATKTIKDGASDISDEAIASYFSKNGKQYESNQIISEYNEYTKTFGGKFSEDMFKESGDAILPLIPELSKSPDKSAIIDKIDGVITNIRSHILQHFTEGFGEHKSDDKRHIVSYALPFGNKAVICNIEIEEGKQKSIKIMSQDIKGGTTLSKIKILDPSDCLMMATSADEHATYGLNNGHKKIESEVQKLSAAINKACSAVEKDIRNNPDDSKKDMFSLEFLRGSFASLMNYVNIYFSYDNTCNRRMLDYVEASLKYYV